MSGTIMSQNSDDNIPDRLHTLVCNTATYNGEWELLSIAATFTLLWSPYVIGQTIIFLPCDFYLLSIFLFFFIPRLISAVADWMSAILPHMVWP